MVAIDESASMLCARVMRGISSIENAVVPASASVRMASGDPSGPAKPITTWPRRSRAVSEGTDRTCRIRSAEENTASRGATLMPALSYAFDGKPAAVPASRSTTTSSPAFFKAAAAGGIKATRFSPGHVSRGTPTFTARSLADLLDPIRNRRRELRRQDAVAALGQRLVDAGQANDFRRRQLLARLGDLGEPIGLAGRDRRIHVAMDDQQRLLHLRDDRRRIVGEHALEHRRIGLLADGIGNAFPSAPVDHR